MSEESLTRTLDKMVSLVTNEALSRDIASEKFMCDSHICSGTQRGHLVVFFKSPDPTLYLQFAWYLQEDLDEECQLQKFTEGFDQLFQSRDELLSRAAGLAGLN